MAKQMKHALVLSDFHTSDAGGTLPYAAPEIQPGATYNEKVVHTYTFIIRYKCVRRQTPAHAHMLADNTHIKVYEPSAGLIWEEERYTLSTCFLYDCRVIYTAWVSYS